MKKESLTKQIESLKSSIEYWRGNYDGLKKSNEILQKNLDEKFRNGANELNAVHFHNETLIEIVRWLVNKDTAVTPPEFLKNRFPRY